MIARSYFRNSMIAAAGVLLASMLLLSNPDRADGAGDSSALRGEDLNISLDWRWAGCSHGGYYPIRIRVTNLRAERVLEFRFSAFDRQGLPTVSKRVALKPNASMQFSLSVPMVGDQSGGTLQVYENGRPIESLSKSISLADVDSAEFDRPAMLVISTKPVDVDQFELGVNSLTGGAASSGYGYGYGYGGSSRTEDHEVVSASMLPDRWIDYSGLDFVAASLDEFERLSPAVRQAILAWTRTGGNLIIYEVKSKAADSERLNRLLELDERAFGGEQRWHSPNLGTRRTVSLVREHELDAAKGYGPVAVESPAGEPEQSVGVQNSREFVWKGADEAFQHRNYMNGKVISFMDNPFPGSRHEWAWLLKTLQQSRYKWTMRHGVSPRHGNSEFLHFLIPGISGVPVLAFLVLITIFSIVIGPMNYFFLAKRKRLYLLVLTIPTIAILTSISLLGYSVVAHGFGIKSRIRSLTVLDQATQKAVDSSRVSLYAGMAPSNGLQLSAQTATYPVWPNQGEETFDGGNLDWTDQQSLEAGFLKSRTRTQFLNVTHRDERGRLQFGTPAQGAMKVDNGFEVDLAQLVVRGTDGKLYYGENIVAGSSATLREAGSDNLSDLANVLRENQAALPDHLNGYDQSYSYGRRYGRYRYQPEVRTYFNSSLMEGQLTRISNSLETELVGRSYFGFYARNPGLDIGVEGTTEREGLHALLGYY